MTQLALVIDLNVCVGCHACVTSCKEWNTSGWAGPMTDLRPYDEDPAGTFFNRVQTYEAGVFPNTETYHFPKSCLHCEDPPLRAGLPDRRLLQTGGQRCGAGRL
jgi:Fe-S-cluster-containing dehydrogenase component